MHKVKVKSDRCYAKWLRRNVEAWWSVYFTTDEDTYTFVSKRDAELLKEHVKYLDDQYAKMILENT
tara:strand:- start:1281 stop:1478 length:198 start_codon:yes stop_codon:yes gene_type:complete